MNNQLVVLLALLNENNEVLISLRRNRADYDGCWEYPGGKVEEGETVDQALIREIKEELNIDISRKCVAPLTFATDIYKKKQSILLLHVCRKWEGNPVSLLNQKTAWVKPVNLVQYEMPSSNVFLNSVLRDWIGGS